MGCVVCEFDCAEEFVRHESEMHVDCIVSDIKMGPMSGIDLLVSMVERGRTVPFVFVTAHATDSNQALARDNGALCVLSKPVHPNDLVHWVTVALERT
jgi:FixJ family two-component response regulator